MSGDERYVLDEAQAEIKRLVAENARLRGEAKKWCDACGCADGANMALRADLAHVTAERDDLKEWKVLHEEFTMDWLARVTAERDDLREGAADMRQIIADFGRAGGMVAEAMPAVACPLDGVETVKLGAAHIAFLTADLARVTAERDGLLKAARARLDIAARVEITPYGDNPSWIAVVADWEAAENALHLAISFCAPPASEKEG
jgi:hypothetical protein